MGLYPLSQKKAERKPRILNDTTTNHSKTTRSNLLLLLASLIWGCAFVAQSVGLSYVGPFTFNGLRFLLGGFVLLPCIYIIDKQRGVRPSVWGTHDPKQRKTLLMGGLCCGIAMTLGSSLQQIGLAYTTVGKAGFITALYIIIVPVMGLFLRKRVSRLVWCSVGLATAGMYLLCITEGFSIGKGDLILLIGAFFFSIHILVIDHFAQRVDGVRLSCLQFFVCGIVSLVPMFTLETPRITDVLAAWMPMLYAGLLSCGVAYTLQIIGQKHTSPTVASLILSLESVFAVLAGWILLGERLSARELAGCALVFFAIVLTQLPTPQKKRQ